MARTHDEYASRQHAPHLVRPVHIDPRVCQQEAHDCCVASACGSVERSHAVLWTAERGRPVFAPAPQPRDASWIHALHEPY